MDKPGGAKRRLDARTIVAAAVVLLLVFGLGVQYQAYLSGVKPGVAQAADIVAVEDFSAGHGDDELIVLLTGEVARRGYYLVSADTSMREIVDFAGVKGQGDISEFDMTHQPAHGDEYYVRSTADPLDVTPWLANSHLPKQDEPEDLALVNLNTATLDELMELPNIGEVKAQAIIDYRTEHSGFSCVEDLLGVDGIGQKIYEQLMDKVTV